jgi:hypothetical protein
MKNASSGLAVVSTGIEARPWNGIAIQRRRADGFVNATAMCKANGKRWNNYARAGRTVEYICALARQVGAETPCAAAVARNSATGIQGLIQVVQGGSPALQGTWIHPRLAVDLARWISPSFAVWMDGWFLEAMGVVIPAPAPQPPAPRRAPAPRGPHQDPLKLAASMLPALIAQRWIGDPEANSMIRAIAQHLLLSCDPLPGLAAVEGEALGWRRGLMARAGRPAW